MIKQKLLPINKIVDSIYDKYILPNHKFERSESKYNRSLPKNSKLTEIDVDLIRYLVIRGKKTGFISDLLGIKPYRVSKIKGCEIFDTYLSPFEYVDKYQQRHVDLLLLEKWEQDNKMKLINLFII